MNYKRFLSPQWSNRKLPEPQRNVMDFLQRYKLPIFAPFSDWFSRLSDPFFKDMHFLQFVCELTDNLCVIQQIFVPCSNSLFIPRPHPPCYYYNWNGQILLCCERWYAADHLLRWKELSCIPFRRNIQQYRLWPAGIIQLIQACLNTSHASIYAVIPCFSNPVPG